MIDNLQAYYLEQLEIALKYALHGRLEACLVLLFELRLKPDISLYARALVNLALFDLTNIEQHPDKTKFAQEGLRIAKELQVCARIFKCFQPCCFTRHIFRGVSRDS